MAFGAAGSGGVARSALPRLIDEYFEVQALKGVGPTLGGPTIGVSPLAGYPEDLRLKDVELIVNNPLNVDAIVQKYPIENNFLSKKGYLTIDAFQLANAKANPLAVRAIFESFQKNKAVEPQVAQRFLDEYQRDPTSVKKNLVLNKVLVYSAVATLLFLLGLADVATATDFYRGWFPDWPGGLDFPRNLLSSEGNVFTIPDYFMVDVPPERMVPR
eukprot:CAMPEP_0194035898 /NCGR_PEP_ID=MMETSP0009_2-20130614/8310_1 /TAXON_ID=210454 /ORGANISM="Grammatophora oceanica, Strain CCMP 410" /LENGTH=214 /DNA_ID=CAMNT_0038677453 /DNA_START=35 /DNA_END=680 /DNA_ORIENTATION=+